MLSLFGALRNVLYVDAAGSGKSLTYQLCLHLFDNGFTGESQMLVVLPLNALCRDAARSLAGVADNLGRGSLLVLAGGAQDSESDASKTGVVTATDAELQRARLILVVPEVLVRHHLRDRHDDVDNYFAKPSLRRRLKRVVLDEAHLFAHWCEFRHACLLTIAWLRSLSDAAMLFLSATITAAQWCFLQYAKREVGAFETVIGDIRKPDLKLRFLVRCGDFDYDVLPIVECLQTSKQTVIVSCSTFSVMRGVVDAIRAADGVMGMKLNSGDVTFHYHGLASDEEKARLFVGDAQPSIIITNSSFSHGVNLKPANGITVFVVGAFDSTLMMFQTIARAARDRQHADVCVIARLTDFTFALAALAKERDELKEKMARIGRAVSDDEKVSSFVCLCMLALSRHRTPFVGARWAARCARR